MSRWTPVVLRLSLVLGALCVVGCYRVVRPEPLVVRPFGTDEVRLMTFPARVVVHDSSSPWDVHQIKDNLTCLFEFEFVRVADMGLDALIPGGELQPIGSGIEGIKYAYSMLPDWLPFRIVDGFFTALALEKMSVSRLSVYSFPRLVYLTDWLQESLADINRTAGYIAPWSGPFIPDAMTHHVGAGVDWAQRGVLGVYLNVVFRLNNLADDVIDAGEGGWGGVVSLVDREADAADELLVTAPPQDGADVVK